MISMDLAQDCSNSSGITAVLRLAIVILSLVTAFSDTVGCRYNVVQYDTYITAVYLGRIYIRV